MRMNVACGLIGLAMLVGCGGGVQDSVEDAEGSDERAVEDRVFAEGVGEDKCAVLTLEDVMAVTGLPAEEIEQQEVSGCLYSWDEGSVWMRSVRVHESVDRAKSYYATFTEDVTAEEVGAAKDQVKDELSDREESGEVTATEGAAGGALTDAMPERDYTHRSLPGIGNEASNDGHGTVRIRWGNLTITFSGKTADGTDHIASDRATEIGRRIVANLENM